MVATGSLPDETGFQRWVPQEARLPGIEKGGVWSPEAVLRREARLGDAVVSMTRASNWRGVGTAWALAEAGKKVTIVTPGAFVGKEMARTAADGAVRRRLGALGVRMLTGAPPGALARQRGDGAVVPDRGGRGDPGLGSGDGDDEPGFDPFPETFPGKACTGSATARHPAGGLCVPRGAEAGAYAFHAGQFARLICCGHSGKVNLTPHVVWRGKPPARARSKPIG
jgi:hypothetical protein